MPFYLFHNLSVCQSAQKHSTYIDYTVNVARTTKMWTQIAFALCDWVTRNYECQIKGFYM